MGPIEISQYKDKFSQKLTEWDTYINHLPKPQQKIERIRRASFEAQLQSLCLPTHANYRTIEAELTGRYARLVAAVARVHDLAARAPFHAAARTAPPRVLRRPLRV